MYLAVMGGFILFIIPGILFLFWFSPSTQAVVIENISGFSALKRSKQLMKGNIGTVFVLGILLGVVSAGIQIGSAFVPQPHLQIIAQTLAQAIVTIIGAAAFVVFYFSCRCGHESFDLQLLAESFGDDDQPDQDANSADDFGDEV